MRKHITTLVFIFTSSLIVYAAPKITIDELKEKRSAFLKLSPEERAKYVSERKEKAEKRFGGYVRNTKDQHGRILIANTQSKTSIDGVRKAIAKLANRLRIAIDVENLPSATVKDAKKLLSEKETAAIIFITITDNCTTPLLVAPENCWAEVNVGALGTENIEERTLKEVLRAFAYLCGATSSSYPNPLSMPVTDVKQLDLIEITELPIDVVLRFPNYLKALGVTPYVQATYRTACRQGWAPAPTNEYQKAIWDKVHTVPKNPMKIEFDPKKGR